MPLNADRVSPELQRQFNDVFGAPENYSQPEANATPAENVVADSQAPVENQSVEAGNDEDAFLKADPTDHPDIAKLKSDLQKGFHRKMQKLSEDARRSAAEISAKEQKAQAFDALLNHPDPGALLATLRSGQSQPAAAPMASVPRTQMSLPDALKEKFEPETLNAIQELLDLHFQSAYQQQLLPVLTPYQRMVEQYGQSQYENKWSELKKEFPTADKYRKVAEDLAVQQNLPLRQALLLASDGAIVSERLRGEAEAQRAKTLTPAGAPAAMTRPSRGRIALDKDSIARQIAADAKRLGIADSLFNRY